MLYRVHLVRVGLELTTLMVINTDYTGSCKFNYHTITTISAPLMVFESTSTFTIREYINTYTASSIYLLYLPDATLCQIFAAGRLYLGFHNAPFKFTAMI
jgi:hypothetical protein